MPVIVVGADTEAGRAAIEALAGREGGEIRAFVSDAAAAPQLRNMGVKVATGDLSDSSHVAGAALNAHTAVLIEEASRDRRERSFADTPIAVADAWASAVAESGVIRVIWVGPGAVPDSLQEAAPESVGVDPSNLTGSQVGKEVARLDGLETLP